MSEQKNADTKIKNTTQKAGNVDIVWDDSTMVSSYSNVATAMANREEFSLLYGTHQTWRGSASDGNDVTVALSNRILMSPYAAKRFATVLSQSIRNYEEKYGAIEV